MACDTTEARGFDLCHCKEEHVPNLMGKTPKATAVTELQQHSSGGSQSSEGFQQPWPPEGLCSRSNERRETTYHTQCPLQHNSTRTPLVPIHRGEKKRYNSREALYQGKQQMQSQVRVTAVSEGKALGYLCMFRGQEREIILKVMPQILFI